MPISEKEYNGYVFDQLAILERLARVAAAEKSEGVLKEIAFERKQIERKLYQQPPLVKQE